MPGHGRMWAIWIVLAHAGLVWAGGAESAFPEASARGPELQAIAPGTVIGDHEPPGWTHLVIKSIPRLASGDLSTLPQSAFRTATLFRTVILADVRARADEPSRFELRRIGVGLCVPDRSRADVMVDSRHLDAPGLDLGLVDRVVLRSAEAELARGRIVMSTPTFALYLCRPGSWKMECTSR